jgi:CHRD domain/Secretion system C-terminal sorting domain
LGQFIFLFETDVRCVPYLLVFSFYFNCNYKNKRMTQFYPAFSARFAKSFLLFVFSLFAFYASQGQVYYATLSGAIEVPVNNSAGTGKAVVTINGNLMRVQVTFSGLTGNTTASHIHAPTAVPLSVTSTAGVATTTPTFTGFPLGVTAGTYDHTFDMTLASSYNPSYVTANGGTPASAFVALKAAMSAGKSYLNIHSTFAGGGEIRGFLLACPNITVSIPDAFALAQGVLPNTVYPPYAPASSLTLQANVTGGTTPYTYSWSNSATSSSITVSPTVATTYSVTVTDQNGCPGSASKTVNVLDVAGGNKGQNIVVCHKGNTQAVAAPAVPAHLAHGDMLGSCNDASQSVTARETVTKQMSKDEFSVRVLSNPSPNYFELQLDGNAGSKIELKVYDLQGRVIETKPSLQSNQTLRLGAFYNPGIYLVQITQGTQVQTIRLIKTK